MTKDMYNEYVEEKSWEEIDFGKFKRADDLYFEAELSRYKLDYTSPIKIYEVGFGNGVFAGWVKSKGYIYSGSELLDELVNRGIRKGFDVFKDAEVDDNLSKSSVDLIVAWDVFEHLSLDDLINSLKTYQNYLKPNGMILARVPSGDSPFGRSIYHGDITHKTALGSSAVRQIAKKCGYVVMDISAPKLPVRGLGIKRGTKRFLVLMSQRLIGKLINIIFHNNDQGIITSNMVFILKKPDK